MLYRAQINQPAYSGHADHALGYLDLRVTDIARCTALDCISCAQTCEDALRSLPAYASSAPFNAEQLALVACADTCRRTAAAIERSDAVAAACSWCADVCTTVASSGLSAVAAPAAQCAGTCAELSSRLQPGRLSDRAGP